MRGNVRHRSIWRRILRFLVTAGKVVITCVLTCALILCALNVYICVRESSRILTPEEAQDIEVDAIIVLGAAVWNGDTPSPMLQDRLDCGIALYESGCAPKMLMSGDHGTLYYNEVGTMLQYAVDHGVPAEDVFLDHAGFSTYESLYRAKYIYGADSVVICTQTYHLYRAMYIGDMLGMEVYGVPAETREYAGQMYYNVREFAARIKDFGYCIFWPDPTHLGDPIDLNGSGVITH